MFFKDLVEKAKALLTEDTNEFELIDMEELTEEEESELLAMEEFQLLDEQMKRKALKRDIIARRIGKTSVTVAKQNDDILYKKMKFHWEKFVFYRAELRKKYKNKSKGIVGNKTHK
jgi:hypothetical protein